MENLIIEGDPTIKLTKGDSRTIPISFEDEEGNIIPFTAGDIIYFTVRASPNALEKAVFITVTDFDNDVAYINIFPEHTKNLRSKTYVYDIQYTKYDGTVITIIPTSEFRLLSEVTYE